MNTTIKLNDEIAIDLEKLMVSRLLIQANSGGGKSYAIRRIIEQSFGKVQIIVLDPEGEFTNLREKFDFVYCGKGGDAPVESRSAALLAHRLLEVKASAIVDLYELPPQERKHFVRLFCEAMVNAPKELWHDVLVIIDEAHVFAPEKGESEAMGPVIDLATRGRKRGYCVVLATQRLPKLHKDATAECNNKLIGRASQDIDRKRAAEELGFTTKEQILSLRDLDPGEFYVFGPAINRDVIRTRIGEVTVKPPARGAARTFKAPPPSAAVKKILSELKDIPQEAEQQAKTIAEFKKENVVLKAEVTRLRADDKPHETSKEIQKKWYDLGIAAIETRMKREIALLQKKELDQTAKHQATLKRIAALVGAEYLVPAITPREIKMSKLSHGDGINIISDDAHDIPKTLARMDTRNDALDEPKPLSKGARIALSYLSSVYPQWKSKAQLWVASGYAPGGGFNNIVYELTGAGLIQKDAAGKYSSLEAHSSDMIDPSFDPSLSKWDAKLSLGAGKVFRLLLQNPDERFNKDYIAQETGYALGGGFNNLIYELTGKELAIKVGTEYQINPEMLDL